MVCFDIYLNERKLCRAGVGASGVLSTIITWAGRASEEPERPFLSVGGLYESGPGDGHAHPRWVEHQKLAAGDEVILRVVDTDTADPPMAIDRTTIEELEVQQRAYYEQMKSRFEGAE